MQGLYNKTEPINLGLQTIAQQGIGLFMASENNPEWNNSLFGWPSLKVQSLSGFETSSDGNWYRRRNCGFLTDKFGRIRDVVSAR